MNVLCRIWLTSVAGEWGPPSIARRKQFRDKLDMDGDCCVSVAGQDFVCIWLTSDRSLDMNRQ